MTVGRKNPRLEPTGQKKKKKKNPQKKEKPPNLELMVVRKKGRTGKKGGVGRVPRDL